MVLLDASRCIVDNRTNREYVSSSILYLKIIGSYVQSIDTRGAVSDMKGPYHVLRPSISSPSARGMCRATWHCARVLHVPVAVDLSLIQGSVHTEPYTASTQGIDRYSQMLIFFNWIPETPDQESCFISHKCDFAVGKTPNLTPIT